MRNLSILFLFFAFVQCAEPTEYEKIAGFCRENGLDDLSKYSTVVVINEEGNCLNCNNSFAISQAKSIEEESILFIVSGSGTRVDISPYLNRSASNVILDSKDAFRKLNLVQSCAVISLSKNQIEKITPISAKNIGLFR